jgi:type I restriction enzyme S subunit
MKKNWDKVKLGDLCEVITKGTTPTSIGFKFTDNGINFIKVESLTESGEIIPNKVAYIDEDCHKALKRSQLKKDDILFSIAGALGRIGIVKEGVLPANTNQALAIIRLNIDSNALVEFMAKYFISNIVTDEIEKLRIGAAQQNLSLTQLKNLYVPLPPLSEQQRIVSILDKAFAAIDKAKANAEQNLKNAKELFESYLQGVFEKKGDGWEEKTIGDLGKPSMCKRILKEQTTTEGDIPFYKIGTFGKLPNAFISKELYDEYRNKYSFPKKGDILISASGTIGRRVIYDGKPAFFQDSNIVWIDNNEKQVLNDYFYSFYGFCDWQPAKGATIARLYNSNLKQIKISFPKSLVEQKNIVLKIDALRAETQKMETIYQKKMDDLEELKKSILQKAFAGELETEKAVAV